MARPGAFACVAAKARAQCPPGLESAAVAVVAVAHEVQHVERIYDEAEAECNARQYARVVGRGLGLPARVAARLAAFTDGAMTQPDEYSSSECRRGGKLDLRLPGGWPQGQ